MPQLIGKISVNPKKIVPGESVLIEVFDPQNISYASSKYKNQTSTYVCIESIHGAKQYLQFAKEGNYPIQIRVVRTTQGKSQQQTKTLTLKVKNLVSKSHSKTHHAQALIPSAGSSGLLNFSASFERPYSARFSVASSPSSNSMPTLQSSKSKEPAATSQFTYRWKLDNGVNVETKEPYLEYDFESLLDANPNRLYQNFHVEMSIKAHGSKKFSKPSIRTLTVYNTYAQSKKRGYIVPRTYNPYLATKVADGFEAVLGIENLEDQPLLLTHQRVQPLGTSDFSPAIELDSPIVIQPKTAHALSFTIDPLLLPTGSSSFMLFLGGHRQEKTKNPGMPVRVEATFEIQTTEDASARAKTAPNLALSATRAIKHEVKTIELGPTGVLLAEMMPTQQLRDHTVARLIKRSKKGKKSKHKVTMSLAKYQPALSEMVSKIIPPQSKSSTKELSLQVPQQQMPMAGALCDPSENGIAGGMVCQLYNQTGDEYEVEVPGHFINAQKGDIILSLGGDGVIAHLLRRVDPPQFYDHSGMITQELSKEVKDGKYNYLPQQITHSTATTDRWLHHLETHFDGTLKQISIKEDVLKYSWPGLITQDTDKAIGSKDDSKDKIQDPNYPEKFYEIHSFDPSPRYVFSQKESRWVLIRPMIVKPDPMLETAEIRQLLKEVAAEARDNALYGSQQSKSHYRLSMYTDASKDSPVPASGTWESNTWPSVCSSYIWHLLNKRGVHLEGDLEADEIGQTDKGKVDGLYYYTSTERDKAAKYLYQTIFSSAKQFAEKNIEVQNLVKWGLADIDELAKQLANQIINTFTKDDASASSAQSLLPVGVGHAVSPADVMFWDGIETGGVYGYHVPAKFRPEHKRKIRVYRWTPFSKTGSLTGVVTYNINPVAGAKVQLFKDKQTQTGADGTFRLEGIPIGWHRLEVTKEDTTTGTVLRVMQDVEIVTPENPVSVELSSQGRLLIIDGLGISLNGKNPDNQSPKQDILQLSPVNPHEEIIQIAEWSQLGLRLEIRTKADWQDNLDLNISVSPSVFFGGSESSTPIGESNKTIKVNQKESITFKARPLSGQELSVSLTFENQEGLA
jgi:hypothetical protein